MNKPLEFLLLAGLAMVAALASGQLSAKESNYGDIDNPRPGYIYGEVVRIADGDTLTLLTADKEQVRIRLAEIDTPERGQPYAQKAQDALSSLVWGKSIAVKVVDTDRYGRIVGRIYVGETDVSAEMVRLGAAWVYRRYVTDATLFDLEADAQEAGRGLWGLSEAERTPPWEWRRRR